MMQSLISQRRERAGRKPSGGGLAIGEIGAPQEREADRMAGQALSASAPRPAWSVSQLNILPSVERAPKAVRNALNSPGMSLDAATRGFFESRFGRDLSGVRIHTDASAVESADAVNASAYAVGPHVVFSKGRYEPDSEKGRRLLAHELAHVIQPEASPVLRRQPKDESTGGAVRPLVQKFLEGKATEAEKATLKKMLLNNELTEAEITALQNHVEGDFKAALEKQIKGQAQPGGQIQVTIPKEEEDLHKFFKARLRLRLSGAAKVLAGGLEGTVETSVEIVGNKKAKTLTVTVTPPEGDTALAAQIRARVFTKGPLVFTLGETALKIASMVSIQGEIPLTVTGDSSAKSSGGLLVVSKDVPKDATLDLAISPSDGPPVLAPPTGEPALPSPRAFVTGGIATTQAATPGSTRKLAGATTLGFDYPIATDTKDPQYYLGVGVRGTADTRGAVSGSGAVFVGAHISPITAQLAFEAGFARVPGSGIGPDSGAKTGGVFGVEGSIGYKLKHLEIMALASVIGGKDEPVGASVQAGAAYRF